MLSAPLDSSIVEATLVTHGVSVFQVTRNLVVILHVYHDVCVGARAATIATLLGDTTPMAQRAPQVQQY